MQIPFFPFRSSRIAIVALFFFPPQARHCRRFLHRATMSLFSSSPYSFSSRPPFGTDRASLFRRRQGNAERSVAVIAASPFFFNPFYEGEGSSPP